MNDQPLPAPPIARNPKTEAAYRRSVFWQVTLPLMLGIVIFLGAGLGVALADNNAVSRWADVATLWLLLPWLLVTLIFLVILGGLAYLMARLLIALPPFAHRVQIVFARIAALVRQYSDQATEPVLRYDSFWAGLRTLWRR